MIMISHTVHCRWLDTPGQNFVCMPALVLLSFHWQNKSDFFFILK